MESKKQSFTEVYKSQTNKDFLRKYAFTYFNDKYFKKPFQEYFIFEQQDRFLARRLKFFIPGRVYTFQYEPHHKDILSGYDKRPMLFVIGEFISSSTGYNILQGINLNFLPEKGRVLFFETATSIFGKSYDKADEESDKGKLYNMRSIFQFVTDWQFMIDNFDKRAKIGLSYAIRNYDTAIIKNPVLIEMEDFAMIPYFIPRELVGIPPAAVYQKYLKTRENTVSSSERKTDQQKAREQQKKYKKPGS
jgi:hypothetical protein